MQLIFFKISLRYVADKMMFNKKKLKSFIPLVFSDFLITLYLIYKNKLKTGSV